MKSKRKVGRKVIATIIIISAVLSEVLLSLFIKHNNSSFTEHLYYWSQIISSIFVISGVVIAVWQYYLSSKAQINLESTNQVQKAIDLSLFYKDNILTPFLPVQYVYDTTGVTRILENAKVNDMQEFDTKEMEDILLPAKIEELKNLQKDEKFFTAVMEANKIYSLNLDLPAAIVEVNESGVKIDGSRVITAFLNKYVLDVLNNMEYFAMHFTHRTADDSVVYASLHQTYLKSMQLLYYNIAKLNEYGNLKYYSNAIELYKKWKTQYDQSQHEIITATRKTIKGTIVSKSIDK